EGGRRKGGGRSGKKAVRGRERGGGFARARARERVQAARGDCATSASTGRRSGLRASVVPRAANCRASHSRGRITKEPGAKSSRAPRHHFVIALIRAFLANSDIALSASASCRGALRTVRLSV